MVECVWCGREMTKHVGCDPVPFKDGKGQVRYGEEEMDWGASTGAPCHDCGCPPGTYHHPGCDVERCVLCGGQAAFCDCDRDVTLERGRRNHRLRAEDITFDDAEDAFRANPTPATAATLLRVALEYHADDMIGDDTLRSTAIEITTMAENKLKEDK